ncbi:MAG TPA: hypothetical protein DCW31_11720 [Lactobacillus sp.]|nr:hypothetical protein [Lactobacillus sp.]
MSKSVLITGATRGIGLALAQKYMADGDLVLVGTRDLNLGLDVVDELRANGGQARLLQIDLTDHGSVMQAGQWIGEQFGKLDLLINNAGVFDDHDIQASREDAESLHQTFDVNVMGTYLVTQQMLPWLQAADDGMVISMSDELATFANFAESTPTTGLGQRISRMGVNAMTVLLQNEYQDKVHFRAVTPGPIASSPARQGQPVSVAVDLIQKIDQHRGIDWDGKLIGANGVLPF